MRTNIILASLLALVGYWLGESEKSEAQQQECIALQAQTLLSQSTLIDEQRTAMTRTMDWLLTDEVRVKYRPMQPAIAEVSIQIEALQKRLSKFIKSAQTKERLPKTAAVVDLVYQQKKLVRQVRSRYEASLEDHGQAWDISDSQQESLIKNSDLIVAIKDLQQLLDRFRGNASDLDQLELLVIVNAKWTTIAYEFTRSYAILLGNRGGCFWGHPVGVYPIESPEITGDSASFLVIVPGAIGQHSDYSRIRINDKDFLPDYNGVVHYEGIYDAVVGLSVSYRIMNPLTGEISEGNLTPFYAY